MYAVNIYSKLKLKRVSDTKYHAWGVLYPNKSMNFLYVYSRYECDCHEFIESKFHIRSPSTKLLMKYNDIKQKHGMGMGGHVSYARAEKRVSV